ncbi:MAG: hypothetical protein LBG65_07745 [Puniceicoccales bacterium]|jgi:hypothetical protein|nr:hypothetical protein [Puniceicoccales bacterium]
MKTTQKIFLFFINVLILVQVPSLKGGTAPTEFSPEEIGTMAAKLSAIYNIPRSLEVSGSTEYSNNAGQTWEKTGDFHLKWDISGNKYHYVGNPSMEFYQKDGNWTVFFYDENKEGKRILETVTICQELEVPFDKNTFLCFQNIYGEFVDFHKGTFSKIPGGFTFSMRSKPEKNRGDYEDVYTFSTDFKLQKKEIFTVGIKGVRVRKLREYTIPEGMLRDTNGFPYPIQMIGKGFDPKGNESGRARITFHDGVKINRGFLKSDFEPRIPVGTSVLDSVNNRSYTQTSDGVPDVETDLAKRIDDFIEKKEEKPKP